MVGLLVSSLWGDSEVPFTGDGVDAALLLQLPLGLVSKTAFILYLEEPIHTNMHTICT